MLPKIVIVGRPNVGKSSLFNRLADKKLAIVEDIAGVTRDSKEYMIYLDNMPFLLVDTAGWNEFSNEVKGIKLSEIEEYKKLQENIKTQIINSIKLSSIILFVIDGQNGLSANDFMFLELIRKNYNRIDNNNILRKILLLVNKVDGTIESKNAGRKYNIDINEITKFGFEYMYISAKHAVGIDKLKGRISDLLREYSYKIDNLNEHSEITKNDNLNYTENSDNISNEDTKIAYEKKIGENLTTTDENPKYHTTESAELNTESAELNIAIVGRPNVGKSTLFNNILGYERVITSSIPGTTRDAISSIINVDLNAFSKSYSKEIHQHHNNHSDITEKIEEDTNRITHSSICIIDTAGMRKKNKVISTNNNVIEYNSVGQSISAVKRANVVVLMIDATEITSVDNIFSKQDLTIIDFVVNEGKGLILVFNKCDMVEKISIFKKYVNDMVNTVITKITNIPVLFTSLVNSIDRDAFFKTINKVYNSCIIQIKTSKLNKWSKAFTNKNPKFIKITDGSVAKMKYITQTAMKPPSFCIFINKSAKISQNHIRFISKSLAEEFKLTGVPIRIDVRSSANPYKPS